MMSARKASAPHDDGDGPPATGDSPVWEIDGRDWPNRKASRFVNASGLRWHVQESGRGPVLLLVHGTGSATHSWRGIEPLLARNFAVVAPDLPGHGFTSPPPSRRLSLPAMAAALGELLTVLDRHPVVAVGHSAGAAVLMRMALDGRIAPKLIVSLNGALAPFDGIAGHLFSALAKLLFVNPLVSHLVAWRAGTRAAVDRMIRNTGSIIDPAGIDFYTRLVRRSDHVRAALAMMANWDLATLIADLPNLKTRVVMVATGEDRAVPAESAFAVRDLMTDAEVAYLRGLGHLAHEEAPGIVDRIIGNAARAAGVIADK
jgi:magnesium chelatase accessory protein